MAREKHASDNLHNGVLKKWQRRLWSDAFNKWKGQHESVKREEKQEDRTE